MKRLSFLFVTCKRLFLKWGPEYFFFTAVCLPVYLPYNFMPTCHSETVYKFSSSSSQSLVFYCSVFVDLSFWSTLQDCYFFFCSKEMLMCCRAFILDHISKFQRASVLAKQKWCVFIPAAPATHLYHTVYLARKKGREHVFVPASFAMPLSWPVCFAHKKCR